MSESGGVRTYFQVTGGTKSDIAGQLAAIQRRLTRRLDSVEHTLAVMSGKGGVGKSVITANLAAALAADGLAVGVVDADLNGPSAARTLGVQRQALRVDRNGVAPGVGAAGVRVMSMDLLLASEDSPVDWAGPPEESFVWRGAVETNALREFLSDTRWGDLDYLILDLPPGTERIAAIRDLLPGLGGFIAVTVPSDLSRFVVGKSLRMVRDLEMPVLGYVLNMAGYECPHCGALGPLFETGDPIFPEERRLAAVPFDPELGRETDAGRPYVLGGGASRAAQALRELASEVRRLCDDHSTGETP